MKRRFDLSLGQTVAVVLAGGVLMASTFLLMPLLHLERGHNALTFWLRFALSFSPLLVGGFFNFKGGSELKDSIANQCWPQEAVASFRTTFKSIPWQGVSIGMMIVGCVMMLSSTHPHDIAWFLFILGQSLARMPWIFHQPTGALPPSNDWRKGPILSSEHWGER